MSPTIVWEKYWNRLETTQTLKRKFMYTVYKLKENAEPGKVPIPTPLKGVSQPSAIIHSTSPTSPIQGSACWRLQNAISFLTQSNQVINRVLWPLRPGSSMAMVEQGRAEVIGTLYMPIPPKALGTQLNTSIYQTKSGEQFTR